MKNFQNLKILKNSRVLKLKKNSNISLKFDILIIEILLFLWFLKDQKFYSLHKKPSKSSYKKNFKKVLKKQNKPYIVTHWHAALN